MKDFLAFIGITTIMVCTYFIMYGVFVAVKDLIHKAKYRYLCKHRFDKLPTAKCYCVDCKYHDDKTKRCYRFGETTKEYRCTADYWFCWEAEPFERVKE